jgi:HD-GYP domain-containing protein (c-di-GMP phosphodiesterase class II)
MSSYVTPAARTFLGLLHALTGVMGAAKGYLRAHGPQVALLSRQIGRGAGMSETDLARVTLAGVLADVGMIGLAERAWEEAVPVLDRDTRERVRRHPIRSAQTLGGIPYLEGLVDVVRHHHEWYDGSGYPDGLGGDEIPLGARVLRLADTIVALSNARPHRDPYDPDRLRATLEEYRGAEFDPRVVEVYFDLSASGGIAPFDAHAYKRFVRSASEALVPDDVSPLSSDQLLEILASIIDAKDPYTAGHSRRVAIFSVAVADQLGLDAEMKGTLWAAGYLHDLGKLAVPVRVLASPTNLSPDEFDLVRAHTTIGAEILASIPSLRHLRTGARYHHERWDGAGYPEGLAGRNIPLVPRILAIADAYDAMTTGRAYRHGRAHREAIDEIRREAGHHFCPAVVEAFLGLPTAFFEAIATPSRSRPEPLVMPVRQAVREAWRYF